MGELRLEQLHRRHLTDLDVLVRDPLTLRHTPLPEPVPADQAASMLRAYESDDTRMAFAAIDEAGRFVALGVAVRIDRVAEECELGYLVMPSARGAGVATELLALLTRWAFAELEVERVQLRINAGNTASERVAERNGYTREGLLRSTYLKPGVRVDTAIWSRLRDDPGPPAGGQRPQPGPADRRT